MTQDLVLIFIAHFVADFLLQSRTMGKTKSTNFKVLLQHLFIIYTVIFSVTHDFKFSLANAIIHGIIDWNIWKLYKLSVRYRDKTATEETWKYWEDSLFYTTIGLDQLLHALTILLLYGNI